MTQPNKRCSWVSDDPLYITYHDEEWGVPLRDEQRMFEFLTLETFQSGLSWITILKKRENFRAAFDGFDAEKIAQYGDLEKERLLNDLGIIRNKRKVDAAIANAQATLTLRREAQGLSAYFWSFINDTPLQNAWARHEDVPAQTALSTKIAKDMKKRGFKHVGPTVIYAHMQATGMVNDHTTDCFRYAEIKALSA